MSTCLFFGIVHYTLTNYTCPVVLVDPFVLETDLESLPAANSKKLKHDPG